MARDGTVTLATLIRGKSYKIHHNGEYLEFKRNIPMEVSDELAVLLEEETDTMSVENSSDVIEVDRFRVERDQQPLAVQEGEVTRRRLRLMTEDVPLRPRRAPVIKKPTAAFKAKAPARAGR